MFLVIFSPSSFSWNEWNVRHFSSSQPKQLNLVPRSSWLTVHYPARTLHCWRHFLANTKFFQIWSSLTGYGELNVCFYPKRIGKIFWMNNNNNYFTRACSVWDNYRQLGAKRPVGYLPSHIQRALVEKLLKIICPCKTYSKRYGTALRYNDLWYNDILNITIKI